MRAQAVFRGTLRVHTRLARRVHTRLARIVHAPSGTSSPPATLPEESPHLPQRAVGAHDEAA